MARLSRSRSHLLSLALATFVVMLCGVASALAVDPRLITFQGIGGSGTGSGVFTISPDGSNLKMISPGSQPSFSRDGKTIVFVKLGEIFTMDANGGNLKQVTDDKLENNQPALSPDGKTIAFTGTRPSKALHHLPDFWKAVALARLRRALRPDGVLRLWDVVFDFEPAQAEARIETWCASGGDQVEGDWTRAELEEHVRDEHSTFTWLLEPMIERAGFEIATAERSADGIFARYVLRAR